MYPKRTAETVMGMVNIGYWEVKYRPTVSSKIHQ